MNFSMASMGSIISSSSAWSRQKGQQRPLADRGRSHLIGPHRSRWLVHTLAPALHTLALLPHRVVRTKHVLGVEARPMLANKRWTMSFGRLLATTLRRRRLIVVRGGRG